MVQFQLLHSKFHLCSVATRGLLLSTYIKFVNLFPEIKNHIQDVSFRTQGVSCQIRVWTVTPLSTSPTHPTSINSLQLFLKTDDSEGNGSPCRTHPMKSRLPECVGVNTC